MSQPFPSQAVNSRNTPRIGQLLFTVLALLVCALGSLLLSLAWFGVGVTPGLEAEARGMAVIIVWPVTMLVALICSIIALSLGKRQVVASLSFPVALAVLMGIGALISFFLVTSSAITFAVTLILLNIGTICFAIWFLRSTR